MLKVWGPQLPEWGPIYRHNASGTLSTGLAYTHTLTHTHPSHTLTHTPTHTHTHIATVPACMPTYIYDRTYKEP